MWLLFPFRISVDPLLVSEVPFRDLRFGMLYALLLALPIMLGLSRMQQRPPSAASDHAGPIRMPATGFFVVFISVAFVAWMTLFAIYRYLLVAEMLAPLTGLLLLGILFRDERRLLWTSIAALVDPAPVSISFDQMRFPPGSSAARIGRLVPSS